MKIAACMLTGEAFYGTRAKACFETWLKDFDEFQIHSFSPCGFLPITPVGNREGKGSDFDKRHDGMAEAWRAFPDADWFCFASCDAYFWVHNLRQALAEIAVDAPILVGGPHFVKAMADGTTLIYPPGGAGYCLNKHGLTALLKYIRELRNDPAILINDLWEDGFMGFAAKRLGIRYVEHPGFHQVNPMNGSWPQQVPHEKAISYHHLTEAEIRALHHS